MYDCINMAEIALQQHRDRSPTGSQAFVPEEQRCKSELPSGAMEPSSSTGVAEPSSSIGAEEPTCSRRAAVTKKPVALRMLFCTASFARDHQVQITLPLNILFTANKSDVEFYHVTFGHDIALQNWLQHHLQWARALF
jgi:hypothetical protein